MAIFMLFLFSAFGIAEPGWNAMAGQSDERRSILNDSKLPGSFAGVRSSPLVVRFCRSSSR
jgi:hypothetical protein